MSGEREGSSRLPLTAHRLLFGHWPFVQWQDSRLWICEWWFESTRANWSQLLPCANQLAMVPVARLRRAITLTSPITARPEARSTIVAGSGTELTEIRNASDSSNVLN